MALAAAIIACGVWLALSAPARRAGRAHAADRAPRHAARRLAQLEASAAAPGSVGGATRRGGSACSPSSSRSTANWTRRARAAGRRRGRRRVTPRLRSGQIDFDRSDRRRRLPSLRPPPRGLAHHLPGASRHHPRPAGSERRRQVHAARDAGDAAAPERRPHPLRRATTPTSHGAGAARRDRRARPRSVPLSRADRAREPRVLRRAVRRRRRRAAPLRRRWSRPASPIAPTIRSSSFSRGMRQRVALERALIHARASCCSTSRSPGWTTRRRRRWSAGCARCATSGAIVVLATHDLDLAEGLLDQAVFLRDGRDGRVASTRPEALRSTYRSVMTRAGPRDRCSRAPSGSSCART